MMEKEAESERMEVDREMEHGRKQLQARMKEMEKLREALKFLEDELRETRENRIIQDRRSTEHSCALAELRTKVRGCEDHIWSFMIFTSRHMTEPGHLGF